MLSKMTITAANFCLSYFTSYKRLITMETIWMNYLIYSHILRTLKNQLDMYFPQNTSLPVEKHAFGNWKSRRVENCFENAAKICSQKFWTVKMKQIGSSTRSNAEYVPERFGLQNMYMKKTLLSNWWQDTKTFFFKFVKKIACGTNHTNTMIDVGSLNDYFANIGTGLASGSN